MQYLLFIADAPDSPPPPDNPADYSPEAWVDELEARGARLAGDRLRPARDATTVRVRGGELLVTDGPFTEGKEYIAGFDLIECADLDEAIEIASRHPMAKYGMVEIRPIWPFQE